MLELSIYFYYYKAGLLNFFLYAQNIYWVITVDTEKENENVPGLVRILSSCLSWKAGLPFELSNPIRTRSGDE